MINSKPWILVSLFCCLFLACELEQRTESTTATVADSLNQTTKDTLAKIVKEEILPDYDTTQWTDISFLDTSIIVDMKYATTDNFVKEKMYNCSRCFLRPKVAKAVVQIHLELQKEGYGLKMLDCYRPLPIQQKLWDKVPNPNYVTPPKKGSMHNRGSAVDLTIVDASGKELDMGTEFDFFGKRAHHDFTDLPQEILDSRKRLKSMMEKHGFRGIRTEWWHYYFEEGAPGIFKLSEMLWSCKNEKH